MVTTRIYIKKTSKTPHVNLRGWHYPSSDSRPSQILVDTRCPEDKRQPRYPLAECHFPDARLQPYVHSCLVKIQEGVRGVHYFTLFYKNHVRLATNISVGRVDRPYPFRGDVIVMRCAAHDRRSFVNMRGRDSALSDFAVRRFAEFLCLVPNNRTLSALTLDIPPVPGERRSLRKRRARLVYDSV